MLDRILPVVPAILALALPAGGLAAVSFGLVAGVLASFAMVRQCRRPVWLPGQFFVTIMNASHLELTRWGLGHVAIAPDSSVLDVGCGGGLAIQQLLELAPRGVVHGIDYSGASVAVARRTNAAAIRAGRADIRRGSVSSLPYRADTFDVVTAFETHYYWPDLESDLREIRRVLRPGGEVLLVAECYRGERFAAVDVVAMRVIGGAALTADAHRAAARAAGFAGAEVFEEPGKGWICVRAVKDPAAAAIPGPATLAGPGT